MKDWKTIIIGVAVLISVTLNIVVLIQINRTKSEIESDLYRIEKSVSSGLGDRPKTRGSHPELGVGTKASIIQSNVGSILNELDISSDARHAARGTFGRETIGTKVAEIESDMSDLRTDLSRIQDDLKEIKKGTR